MKTISIHGAVGVPAAYGGFETLAENLVRYHGSRQINVNLAVYCSSRKLGGNLPGRHLNADLRYIGISANGMSSVFYDAWSLISAVLKKDDVILLLGVSGAIALPLVRLFSSAKIITNVDGIEWRRAKWTAVAKWFLRFSEFCRLSFHRKSSRILKG